MYYVDSIEAFNSLDKGQVRHLLDSLQVKKRLDAYLVSKAKTRNFTPYSRICEHCDGGEIAIKPRDNSGVHPSSVYGCVKALWYPAADYYYDDTDFTKNVTVKTDARMQMLFDWGTALHTTLQSYGLDGAWGNPSDYHPEAPLDPQINKLAKKLWVKGHADARVDHYVVHNVPTIGDVSVSMIHEYKSMKQEEFDRLYAPKTAHTWQANLYAGLLDVPIVVYLYVAKNTSQSQDFPIPFDKKLWGALRNKIKRVQELVKAWKLPSWKETSAGSPKTQYDCRYCKYQSICKPPDTRLRKETKVSRRTHPIRTFR